MKQNIKQTKRIHRLVVETFISNIPKNKVINHINSNRKDNSLYNLEIITQYENVIHSIQHGSFGCKCSITNKHTDEQLFFKQQTELSKYFGFSKNWCVTRKKRYGNIFEYGEWIISC